MFLFSKLEVGLELKSIQDSLDTATDEQIIIRCLSEWADSQDKSIEQPGSGNGGAQSF